MNLASIGSLFIKLLPYIAEGIQLAESLHTATNDEKRQAAIAHAATVGVQAVADAAGKSVDAAVAADLAGKVVDAAFAAKDAVKAAQGAQAAS